MRPTGYLTCRMLLAVLLCFCLATQAQQRYYVRLTDKAGSAFSVLHPEEFLSQKAVQRRLRQHLEITEEDLPVSAEYIAAITAAGARVLYPLKWDNALVISSADTSLASRLLGLPFIYSLAAISSGGEAVVQKKLEPGPAKSYKSSPADTSVYGVAANQDVMVQVNQLHQQGFRGEGILIAVMDGGFDGIDRDPYLQNAFLAGQIKYTWNYVYDTGFVYGYDPHGSYVFSDLAANLPGQMVGTAPNADFLLFITEDVRSELIIEEYNWVAAAEKADSMGADIISSSLGYTTFDPQDSMFNTTYATLNGHTSPIAVAANRAAAKGLLVVVSAGNEGSSSWHYLTTPADADSAVAVGAVSAEGSPAFFSGFGMPWDTMVKPNLAAQGNPAWVSLGSGNPGQDMGTSFSCPIVAGAFACLRQAMPMVPVMAMIKAVEQSASLHPNPTASMGYGIPDFGLASSLLKAEYPQDTLKVYSNRVFPDPFSDRLTIYFGQATDTALHLELTDALGRLAWSGDYHVQLNRGSLFTVPLPELPKGIYLLRINGAFARRLLKGP